VSEVKDKAYAKLLGLAGQLASYGPVPGVFEETYVERLEAEYKRSRYWVAAALASDHGELHEKLARLDVDLDAIRARQIYPETAIDQLRQELRDDITAYANATPFQKFMRTWLTRLGIVILAVVLYLWVRG
jgi:hypothetical protein